MYILYIHDLANKEMLLKIKKKLDSMDIDSIQNLSLLEQEIEDRPKSMFPSKLYTGFMLTMIWFTILFLTVMRFS